MFVSLSRIHFLWQASERHRCDWIYNPAMFTVIIILCSLRYVKICFSTEENMLSPTTRTSALLPTGLLHPHLPRWKDGCMQHLTFERRFDDSTGDIRSEDDIPPRVLIKWFLLQKSSRWQIVFENNAVCLDRSIQYFLAGKAAWLARRWVRTLEIRALVLVLPPGLCGGMGKHHWNYCASLSPPSLPIEMGSCKT